MKLGTIKNACQINRKGKVKYILVVYALCKKTRWVQFVKGGPRYPRGLCRSCNKKGLRGVQTNNWQGGVHKTYDGYIEIKIYPESPYYAMASNRGYIREHRLIMASHLGRCLHPLEIVHHKNGIKTDNRIQNLKLVNILSHRQLTIIDLKIKKLKLKNMRLIKQVHRLQNKIKLLQRKGMNEKN